jgi:hypothetical protein
MRFHLTMHAAPRSSKLECRLEMIKNPIMVGDTLAYAVVNTGGAALLYGADESLEWHTENGWQQLPLGGWATAVGFIVEPGQRSRTWPLEVTSHLAPGRYRVVKRISRALMTQPDSIIVRNEFEVVLFEDQ